MYSKRLIVAAKLSMTVLLLAIIVAAIEWPELLARFESISLTLAVVVLGIAFLNITISAFKWLVLMQPFQVAISMPTATRLYYVTTFFNNFLPGSVGGDAYRIFKVHKLAGNPVTAVVPVFVERVSGLCVLAVLGTAGAAWHYSLHQDSVSLFGVLLGTAIVGAIGSLLVVAALKDRIISLAVLANRKMLHRIVEKFLNGILLYRNQHRVIRMAIAITLLFYCLNILGRMLLVIAVDEHISVAALASVIMISAVIAMVPISINGYGLLDLSFIHLLTYHGVEYESSVLVMVMNRCVLFVVSLLGGLLYAFSLDARMPVDATAG